MIVRLYIRNYGIIREHEIGFGPGLTVITGETGAGKSILLGALGLVSGERADAQVLFDQAEKCIVEAEFKSANNELRRWLEEEGFDLDESVLVRRELTANGKSRAFINDSPATVQQLRQLAEWLIDISGQHESREMNTARFQYDFLDTLSQCIADADKYQQLHQQRQHMKLKLQRLQEAEATRLQQLDLDTFLLTELEQADLRQPDELSALEQKLEIAENALQLRQLLEGLGYQLGEREDSVISQLQQLANGLSAYKRLHPEIERAYDVLHAAQIELTELSRDTSRMAEMFDTDAASLALMRQRIDQLQRLMHKHRLGDLAGLLERMHQLADQVHALSRAGEETQALEIGVQQLEKELHGLAKTLNTKRKAAISAIEKQLAVLLPMVGLVHAQFNIQLDEGEELLSGRQGYNRLRLLFSANKGSQPNDLHKVASGGELSRLMLCLKSLLHEHAQLPTIVFDEIDTGISGETALQVGKVLRSLANHHQVILITHLPQIAAKGDVHLFISKKNQGDRTVSQVEQLDNEARTLAIARMIAGDQAGETAILQARELLG